MWHNGIPACASAYSLVKEVTIYSHVMAFSWCSDVEVAMISFI
jgi:hypothetical protein